MKGKLIKEQDKYFDKDWDPCYLYDLSEEIKEEYKPSLHFLSAKVEIDDVIIDYIRREGLSCIKHKAVMKYMPVEIRQRYWELYMQDLYLESNEINNQSRR